MADSDMGRFVMEPEDIHWLTLCPTGAGEPVIAGRPDSRRDREPCELP